MGTQELFEQLEVLFDTFRIEHSGKSKAAHGRARKALGGIKKLISEYRNIKYKKVDPFFNINTKQDLEKAFKIMNND